MDSNERCHTSSESATTPGPWGAKLDSVGNPLESRKSVRRRRRQWEIDVSDVDLPGDVQSAAGSSFDHISSMIASGGFERNDFVRMCAHRRCQVLEHEVPTVDEPLGLWVSIC